MICTKCGIENPDDALSCQACGHKLQSGFEGVDRSGPARDDLADLATPRALDPVQRRRLLEAWGVALAVWAAAYVLVVWCELVWPLYPLAALAGLYAWGRGITWRE